MSAYPDLPDQVGLPAVTAEPSRRSSGVIGRTMALALGSFTLLNSAGELVRDDFDANLWWLHPPGLGSTASALFFAVTGLALCAVAIRPPRRRASSLVAQLFAASIATIALCNVVTYYHLLSDATVRSTVPVPFSLVIAGSMLIVLPTLRITPRARWSWKHRLTATALFVALGFFFPLAQMFCFGKTDYRRPADAAVVFGCRVFADGEPSLALHDRTTTAIALYHEGLVDKLVVSGGPGDGAIHEAEAMRTLAIERGVDPDAIVMDRNGLNTWATVKNSSAWLEANGFDRVIAVSHFYHLPRIKMAFRRMGREAYTVPADETRLMKRMPFFMLREVAAFWVYYLRPLVDG